jgi:putative addiction module antidote
LTNSNKTISSTNNHNIPACMYRFSSTVDLTQNRGIICIDGIYGGGGEKMETRKVFKSGNSLVVTLPKEVVDTLAIREGHKLVFEIKSGGVVIKPERKQKQMEALENFIGCLKGQDKLVKEFLSLRDEEDREVEPLE